MMKYEELFVFIIEIRINFTYETDFVQMNT
jgi:hypothetical protein